MRRMTPLRAARSPATKGLQRDQGTGALTANTTYSLTCSGTGGYQHGGDGQQVTYRGTHGHVTAHPTARGVSGAASS